MLNLLTTEQTRHADQYTIQHKPIASVDLMEDAASAFSRSFVSHFPDKTTAITVYCGMGNNGGDGLAIARLLFVEGYESIHVKIACYSEKSTPDFQANLERLKNFSIPIQKFYSGEDLANEDAEIIIDALLGSGLNKPLEGDFARLVNFINNLVSTLVAVDIPSGLFSEGPVNLTDPVVQSDLTICFQRPKINFLLPESASFIKRFEVVDIGLDEAFIQQQETPYLLLTEADIQNTLRSRHSFDHKGTFGHALIIAGKEETMGAALLCAGASLFSGSGLTTACIPSAGLTALNTRYPEVMAILRDRIKLSDIELSKYQSIAIGPGLGTDTDSRKLIEILFHHYKKPIVLDADAINLIAGNYELMAFVPEGSIFTPHVKEFDRLFGDHANWWERLQTGMNRAKTLGCVIVLKNRYTIIFTPDGKCIFNSTGNPAMATGGMGDVLTGMIASFVAQGYSSVQAALLGVYIHGKTGDVLMMEKQMNVIPASLVIKKLPEVMGNFQRSY